MKFLSSLSRRQLLVIVLLADLAMWAILVALWMKAFGG